MRKVRTVSVSLEPESLEILRKLAREKGSTSAAVRHLLRQHQEREWDEQYREYYADPKNVKESLELTKAMLSIASWPQEPYDDEPSPRKRKNRKAR